MTNHDSILTVYGIILMILSGLLIAASIHIQIPDQKYCDTITENRYSAPFGPVLYIESQKGYDFSLKQSKCIYNNGSLIVNPKYSIWGIRI